MTGGVVHGGVAGQLSSCSGRDRPGKPGRPSPLVGRNQVAGACVV